MKYCDKKLLLLALMCMLFMMPCTSQAKEKVTPTKIAYISGADYLVLKFESFSDKPYRFKLTNMDSGKKISGKARISNNEFRLGLKEARMYKADTVYRLTLSSNKKYMEVYYYTGAVVERTAMTATSDLLKTAWAMTGKGSYPVYKVRLANSEKVYAPVIKKDLASRKARGAAVNISRLTSGRYTVYVFGEIKVDGYTCRGYGRASSLSILRKPGKVFGLISTPKASRVILSWNRNLGVSGYQVYYKQGAAGKYKLYKELQGTSLTVGGLRGGKAYYFKVRAFSRAGAKTIYGKPSMTKKQEIPKIAGKVRGAKLTLDSACNVILDWKKTKFATSYLVFYNKVGEAKYKRLTVTKKTRIKLDQLDEDTNYNLVIRARTKIGGRNFLSYYTSKTLQVRPKKFIKDNYNKMLASKVRTIRYSRGRCIYTRKKYSTKIKEAYVNYKNYSSRTKYLIWVSTYTQQATVFKGRKGHWKQIRTFTCATGRYYDRTPRGVFTLNFKEYKWNYINTQIRYISHFYKVASFHTRPLYYNGAVATPTLGQPASHGCVRCPTIDARYIYNSIPLKTTVVSF